MSITKITVVNDDGTTVEFLPPVAPATPVTVNEVDLIESDGSVKKFIPQ